MADEKALRAQVQTKRDISERQLQRLIREKELDTLLPRRLALLALAAESGISIRNHVNSEDDLAQLRAVRQGAGRSSTGTSPQRAEAQSLTVPRRRKASKAAKTVGPRTTKGKKVFIVHGRNTKMRDELAIFLRTLGLEPLEWNKLLAATGKGTPSLDDVLTAAFREAAAVVVLLTPDDDVVLAREFWKPSDEAYEHATVRQARPNVLFEAGMAVGRNADSTVLVQIGAVKPFSDVGGKHITRLTNLAASRRELATKLSNAGCAVDTDGTDWLTLGDFNL